MSLKSHRDCKEKLFEWILFPIGFIARHFFGKKLVYFVFDVPKPVKFFSQDLGENVELSSEITELSFRPPIKIYYGLPNVQIFIEGYEEIYHKYLTERDKFTKHHYFHKPIIPDGTVINPKVRLIDEHGKIYGLKFVWHAYCLGFTAKLPADRKYVKLRISCDIPFKSYLIRWFDSEPEDEK